MINDSLYAEIAQRWIAISERDAKHNHAAIWLEPTRLWFGIAPGGHDPPATTASQLRGSRRSAARLNRREGGDSVTVMSWQPRKSGGRVAPGHARKAVISASAVQEPLRSALESPTLEEETRTAEDLDVPWQVIVHNDPVNLMTYVTMVFQKVFGYPKEKAEKHMLEVHQNGRSILWSGMRERAELYVQQLHGYLLLATLERVG